jgi:hypothetical protein
MIPRRLLSLGMLVFATGAHAQARPAPYTEYRADAIVGRHTSAELGAGPTLILGSYVRLALIGAAGTTWVDNSTRFSARADAIARFTLDPLREVPVALSVGGGVSVPYVQNQTRTRPYLTGVIDLEGRRRGRFSPAVQIGVGGGARIGVALRTSPRAWR